VVTHDQDLIFLMAGSHNRRTTRNSWTAFWWHVDGKPGESVVTNTPAANVERLLSPLAHEARIRILQAIFPAPRSSGELSDLTGLRGGNLYYHLRELIHAEYVTEREGAYDLTGLGLQMLITVTTVASKVVEDRGEEGLLVSGVSST
jgi:DNA-binding transcriptional ArsR family regulator